MQKIVEGTESEGVTYPIPSVTISVLLGLCAFLGCLLSIYTMGAMTRRNAMLVGHLL